VAAPTYFLAAPTYLVAAPTYLVAAKKYLVAAPTYFLAAKKTFLAATPDDVAATPYDVAATPTPPKQSIVTSEPLLTFFCSAFYTVSISAKSEDSGGCFQSQAMKVCDPFLCFDYSHEGMAAFFIQQQCPRGDELLAKTLSV
jgi:hypothetical protein